MDQSDFTALMAFVRETQLRLARLQMQYADEMAQAYAREMVGDDSASHYFDDATETARLIEALIKG